MNPDGREVALPIQPLPFRLLTRAVPVRREEVTALVWSFLYFLCLLASYYILRPLRDEMGIAGGVQNLPWLFTGTFVAMLAAVPLWSALASRLPRGRLIPLAYRFFMGNILLFFVLFQLEGAEVHAARAFFIWTSVFNLFVVSVFWSFMADLFTHEQGKRLFGFIAAGGSAGALLGPALTTILVTRLGPVNLLLLAAALLEAATLIVGRLGRIARQHQAPARDGDAALGGGPFSGIGQVFASRYLLGISAYILFMTMTGTFGYFQQARIVAGTSFTPAARTALFAQIDLLVNAVTIVTQTLLTARIFTRLGLRFALCLMPALSSVGFLALAAAPVLSVLVAFQVVRRALEYAISRPAREVLFTVVSREQKYKSKTFIDTVVHRGGDALSGWTYTALSALGLALPTLALAAVPLSALWVVVGLFLGRRQDQLAKAAPVVSLKAGDRA
ncbi:MAG TPA: MFS transporter [Polyangia bacterium]|jgi:AAA family ATP:ADP antiporter|nr:MFS transporter [Polyangia bacterium]